MRATYHSDKWLLLWNKILRISEKWLFLRLYNPKTHQNEMTGPAVASLKLLAQATGEYTREELNKVAKLGWTDAAAKQIAEAKAAELGGGSTIPSEGDWFKGKRVKK